VLSGDCSAVEVARESIAALVEHGGERALGAVLRVDAEGALAAARTLDDRLVLARRASVDRAELRARYSLAGVTVAVKDSLVTRGLRTTCGSKMLERYVPPYDATVVERLRERGAIVVAKSNMDEFSMGSSTENSAYFVARNPWDRARVPGGSSGGSAVAVAAKLVHVALGSDTGGSIRQPAALTGVVGVKPTYGRVSRYGLIAFASSLDTVGPLASDVVSAELVYAAIAGRDPRDSTSVDRFVDRADFSRARERLRGARVGVIRDLLASTMDAGVRASFEQALSVMESEGAAIVELSLPSTRYAAAAYYVLAPAECSSNLARFDGVRYGFHADGEGSSAEERAAQTRAKGFGPEVKRRILLGTFALSEGYHDEFYEKAQRVRAMIRRDFERAFDAVDVLATPTSLVLPWRLGERTSDPVAMYEADVCTVAPSLAGVAAMSVPIGQAESDSGTWLPVGLQLVAPSFAEASLFELGFAVQNAISPTSVNLNR
jgi:aspartyl-tRNA(Asn)/glutamyl-tRNA(Gln) amidotransferase subunit A